MIAGSRTLGAIVFRFARDRDFDDGTRDLAIRLADQGAQALDRALAWHGDLRSREALERGQGRLALLVRASDVLGSGTDIGAGIAALPGLIVPALADWCAIELLDVDAPELEIGAAPEMRDAVQRLAGAAPRSLGSWLVPARAGDGPTILALGDQATTVPEAAATALAELGTVELLAMPISTPGGDPQGSIVLGAADAGRSGPDDQALVQDLAGRIAAAAGARACCRGHPVQGHRRRQRRRRLHVRPRLAPPRPMSTAAGPTCWAPGLPGSSGRACSSCSPPCRAGLPRPARRPPRRAVLDDDLPEVLAGPTARVPADVILRR